MGVNSHLCGLTTRESARATPSSTASRSSGTIAATPPYAPSTCSHIPSRRQTSAIARTGSMLVVLVVPTVATAAIGRKPAARSRVIASARRSGRMRKAPSVSMCTTFRWPSPSAIAPLSTDECDCVEQYTRIAGTSGRPARPRSRTSSPAASRAAASASIVEMDAVSVIVPNHSPSSPMSCRSQSSATCSSSVALGLVFHSIPLTLSAAASSSPMTPGAELEIAK